LLIGFGVLLGELLLAMGALQKLVGVLLRLLGPERLPYAFSAGLEYHFPGHLRRRPARARGPPWPDLPPRGCVGMDSP
jgi:hypothetical protein